ncbi:hypothetical protein PHYC_00114 [Phycisphaerales bacterium]|nr:hypothetical protein PHYC_00114 [Phycisphaerales bacterium]
MTQNSVPAGPPPGSRDSGQALTLLVVFLYAAALVASVFLLFRGRIELGIAGVLLVLTLAPLAFVLLRAESTRARRALHQRVDEISRSVRMLVEQSSLSDEARRIINRQYEREMLCRAIEEDLAVRNWDAALVLIKELADRFGYRAEAEQFRKKIDQLREQTVEQEITDAIGSLDGLILQRRWNDAYLEAAKIMRLYPYSPRVEPLRERVEQAQQAYKRDLERRFLLAAQADRTDEALTLLKEFDQYLTPTEAEPLRELVRGLIGKARLNLGAQFKLALQDHRWSEAAKIGHDILAEYPNSRMAAEVRLLIDGIRSKAESAA